MDNRQKLQSGLKEMGLDLSGEQQDKLLAYVEMLKKWNKTYNLTLPPYLEGAQTMLDVGSGGGQPGIPAAVCRPDLQITLLDANTKKTSFLQQAAIELELKNVRVVSGRVEAVQGLRADVITSRAFAELADFVNWTAHLLQDGGRWAAMKGVYPAAEIDRLPDSVCVERVDKIRVPQLNAERHMVILRKK